MGFDERRTLFKVTKLLQAKHSKKYQEIKKEYQEIKKISGMKLEHISTTLTII